MEGFNLCLSLFYNQTCIHGCREVTWPALMLVSTKQLHSCSSISLWIWDHQHGNLGNINHPCPVFRWLVFLSIDTQVQQGKDKRLLGVRYKPSSSSLVNFTLFFASSLPLLHLKSGSGLKATLSKSLSTRSDLGAPLRQSQSFAVSSCLQPARASTFSYYINHLGCLALALQLLLFHFFGW